MQRMLGRQPPTSSAPPWATSSIPTTGTTSAASLAELGRRRRERPPTSGAGCSTTTGRGVTWRASAPTSPTIPASTGWCSTSATSTSRRRCAGASATCSTTLPDVAGMVDRQLELIDELERHEVDPDRLQELFRMDHLATRMRRNVENLIVLSGVDRRRRWSESVALRDVVEAAVAEVEEYFRVQVVGIHDLTLAGQAASDVAHLLAELIENLTSFSSPTTRVNSGESDRQRVRARDRGPRDRDERRRAGRGQQAAGRAVGGRRRRVENDGLPRGRPPRGPPGHQCATPSLLVRRGRRAGAAAGGPGRLGWRTPGDGTGGAGRRHGSRRNRSCWPTPRSRAGSRARICRYAGTERRRQTVAGTRMLPLRQASRSSRRRGHDGKL